MKKLIFLALATSSVTAFAEDKCLNRVAVAALEYIESTPSYHKGNLDVHAIFSEDMTSATIKDINGNIEDYELTGSGYMGEGISNYQFSNSTRVINIDVRYNSCKIVDVSSFLKRK